MIFKSTAISHKTLNIPNKQNMIAPIHHAIRFLEIIPAARNPKGIIVRIPYGFNINVHSNQKYKQRIIGMDIIYGLILL
jgi:hypothetical protein